MEINSGIKQYIFFFLMLLMPFLLKAQSDDLLHYSAEIQTTIAPAAKLPFWLRAGKYGSVPLPGTSGAIIGSFYKDYAPANNQFFSDGDSPMLDWSAGVTLRVNAGSKANFSIIEGYIKAKYSIFQVSAGRTKDIVGLVDSTLSSGAFSVSGNALGIPKITLAIPQYYSIPIFDKLLSFKMDYQFGFVGNQQLSDASYVPTAGTYYQENSVYIRLGKPDWRLKLYGGINHEVFSGNEDKIFGSGWTLSPIKSLFYAAIGKTYSPPKDAVKFDALTSKVGNHIGSVDIGADYEFEDIKLSAYRQNLYDVGAISKLANIADGINGISLTNKNYAKNESGWHKFLFEFIYTKDQAGKIDSKVTNSGDEDYYNNYVYTEGWSYKGLNLGNPLLTTSEYTRAGLAAFPGDYFINNRIMAFHTGLEGSLNHIDFTVKATYSVNYGTYGTSVEGHNLAYYKGNITPPVGLFGQVEQFSGYLEAGKTSDKGLFIGAAVAMDLGGLYYNSVGLQLRLKKTFN
jgi:hypothetical protein